jgi:putative membrane protein
MDQTIAKTGVLIFVSIRERRAVVLSDKTISTRVQPEVWSQVVGALTVTAHRSNMTEGIVAAVEKVGELLEPQFPRGPHDINELPDKLIVKV